MFKRLMLISWTLSFLQASAGLGMNVIAVFVLTVGLNTWGNQLFNFDTIPVIFEEIKKNNTLVAQPIVSVFNASTPLVWFVVQHLSDDPNSRDKRTCNTVLYHYTHNKGWIRDNRLLNPWRSCVFSSICTCIHYYCTYIFG